MSNKDNFSYFGNSFQEGLVKLILKDKKFSDQIKEVLEYDFFETIPLQIITKKIYDYRDKYKKHPNVDVINTILNTELNNETEVRREETKKLFNKIVEYDVNNEEYIKEKALDFCKKQNFKKAIIKSSELMNQSSFDEIRKIVNESLSLGIDYDYGHRYIQDFEERYKTHFRGPISTGWIPLDEITGGGLGKGELGIVIATSGAGKSFCLVHLGSNAYLQGKNVVYYTLELSQYVIGKRFDSCLTKIPLDSLKEHQSLVLEKIKEIKNPGRLVVKEYPTRMASVETINNHIEKLKMRGFKPDVILVDYADILKSLGKYKDKRLELEEIYQDLRALAQNQECTVWSASQTNRSAWNSELVDGDQISESFNKVFISDFIISLSRTKEDKQANQGRLYVIKNRFGRDGGAYPMFIDFSNAQMRILGEDETNKIERKSEKEKQKEAYMSYLKEKK